jgi:hypothetical protein
MADIEEDNIPTRIPDKRACEAFVQAELDASSARKLAGRGSVPVHRSRRFGGAAAPDEEAACYPAVLGICWRRRTGTT